MVHSERIARSIRNVAANKHLNAFISLTPNEELLKAAEWSNSYYYKSRERGLEGLQVAIKDNICTIDLPTTCASKMLRDYVSPYEATVVKNLRSAGGIIIGKTNMDEFGMGSHSTHSIFGAVSLPRAAPFAPARSAGGSSGGSAVAVAADMCDAALGTDTGGSVRLPASYCGVVGFKPSYGMLSRWGVIAYANSLDTVGIMAKDVQVTKLIFDNINSYDSNDPTSLSRETRERLKDRLQMIKPSKIRRIGIAQEYNVEELTPVVRAAWERTINHLSEQGHMIVPISLPHTKHALSAYYVLAPAEASSNLAKYDGVRYGHREEQDRSKRGEILFAPTRQAGFGDEVRRRILMGAYALSSETIDNYFIQAQKVRRLIQQDFNNVFAQPNWLTIDNEEADLKRKNGKVDAIIAPCSLSTAPLLEDLNNQSSPLDSYVNDVLTVPASLAGIPAISIPVLVNDEATEETSSIGIQVMAQYGDEDTMFDIANLIEDQPKSYSYRFF